MINRYQQSRERSAELLRAALRHIGQHDVSCNPVSFAVWYEYAAGINQGLSQAVDRQAPVTPRLDDAAMLRLYQDHVLDPDQAAVDRISQELQRVMSGVAENASQTGQSAGSFGDQVHSLAAALESRDLAAAAPLLAGVSNSARVLKGSSQALADQVAHGQAEIERLRADLARARDEALLDPLTQVFNRKGFEQRIQWLLKHPAAAGQAHGLVMIDIDHFKAVNDTHGHVFGDQVLRGMAEVMRGCITDPRCTVARYGGEEFAVLLGSSSPAEGLHTAELLRQRIKAMKIRDRRTQEVILRVTVSAGFSSLAASDDSTSWVSRADAALYKAKQGGRDRVVSA